MKEAGYWVLQEPDAMEVKTYLDNPYFQKKTIHTYTFCMIFLQKCITLHSVNEDCTLSKNRTWMSLQCIHFSPFSASCNGIFLCYDAPCAEIPLSHYCQHKWFMQSIRCNTKDISNINVCLGKYFYGVDKWRWKQTPAQISHFMPTQLRAKQ